jgi:hypothetical protein
LNQRLDDLILRAAYGEASAEDLAELKLRAASDPKIQAKLDRHLTVCEAMQSLKEVPVSQLSNERLREAVLRQGLKPEAKRSSIWSWAWMPTASFILVLMILPLSKGWMSSAEPQVVLKSDLTPSPVAKVEEIRRGPVVPQPVRASLVAANTTGKPVSAPVRRAVRKAQKPEKVVSNAMLYTMLVSDEPAGRSTTAAPPKPVVTPKATKHVPTEAPADPGEPIILVDRGPDPATATGGRATESKDTNAILVGG